MPGSHGCSTGTCTGACCAVFPLSTGYRMFSPQMGAVISDEEAKIAHMIVPLTVEEADARMARLGYEPVPLHDGYALFTCRHWDEETRLCGAYDERPDMCRKYPYGSACERGCGYELSPEDRAAFYGESEREASPFEWSESDQAWTPRDTAEWVWDGAMIRERR